MGEEQMERRVFRDGRYGCFIIGIMVVLAVGLAIELVVAVGDHPRPVVQEGRLHMPDTAPALLFLAVPAYAVLLYALALSRRASISMDDVGIVATNVWGRETFRAVWEDVTDISQNRQGQTVVIAGKKTLPIRNDRVRIIEILTILKERTGKALM